MNALRLAALRLGLAVWLFWTAIAAFAGSQKEEAMDDSVRAALSQAITDPRPPKPQFAEIDDRI